MQGCWGEDALKFNSAQLGGQQYVRVIPLLDDVAVAEGLDPWPIGTLDPSIYKSGIEQRWKAIIAVELQALWWGKALGWFGGPVSERQVAAFAIQKMNEALKEWGLAR